MAKVMKKGILLLALVGVIFAQQEGDSGEGAFDGGPDDDGGPQFAGTDDFGGERDGDGFGEGDERQFAGTDGGDGGFDDDGSQFAGNEGFDGGRDVGSESTNSDAPSGEDFSDSFNRKKRSPQPYPIIRVKRGGHKGYGVVGPVHTHVRTDYHGNFQWGVKHRVGGHGGGGYHG